MLWADAICIDQQNIEERGKQVQLMGMIYWKADRVLVWLGQNIAENDRLINVEEAFAWICESNMIFKAKEEVCGDAKEVPPVTSDDIAGLTELEVDRWEAVSILLSSPWFRRVWVMQEIGLAAEALVFCGDAEIEAAELLDFYLWVMGSGQALYNHFFIHLTQQTVWYEYWLATRPEYKTVAEKSTKLSFIEVLAFARRLEATGPRGHVFTFLGHPAALRFLLGREAAAGVGYGSIISLGTKPLIQPDYAKSLGEIYTGFVVEVFEATHNLDLLSYIIHFENSIEEVIPSWVPRWDLPGGSHVSLGTDHQSKYYNASRGSYPTSPTFIKSNELNGLSGLRLGALFVDRIEWTYGITMPVWTCFALLKYDFA